MWQTAPTFVAVGVADERPVATGVVLRPQPRLVQGLGTARHGGVEEGPHRCPVRCREGHVGFSEAIAVAWRPTQKSGLRGTPWPIASPKSMTRAGRPAAQAGAIERGAGRPGQRTGSKHDRAWGHPAGKLPAGHTFTSYRLQQSRILGPLDAFAEGPHTRRLCPSPWPAVSAPKLREGRG